MSVKLEGDDDILYFGKSCSSSSSKFGANGVGEAAPHPQTETSNLALKNSVLETKVQVMECKMETQKLTAIIETIQTEMAELKEEQRAILNKMKESRAKAEAEHNEMIEIIQNTVQLTKQQQQQQKESEKKEIEKKKPIKQKRQQKQQKKQQQQQQKKKKKEDEGEDDDDDEKNEEEKEEDEEYGYDVEKVLNFKVDKSGKLQYFVKWVGYSSIWNSWEPRDNLAHLPVVQQYEAGNVLEPNAGSSNSKAATSTNQKGRPRRGDQNHQQQQGNKAESSTGSSSSQIGKKRRFI